MSDTCLFCRIVQGEIPATIVAESDHAIAFRDINPQAPVHVLVIPKTHIVSLAEAEQADPQILAAVLQLAGKVAKDHGIEESGYRTVINTNGDAGQTVHHLHAHVIGGRHMAWPPG
jgi:histidine triad (HIT) family protein